ncbi:hypothetical protein BKA70DRAFT_1329073 [Coprinopsis sp. MPI-PUGE-AT-0042]|nr:hypothetical protein BKA70DRAFT_1329073 [Coprinopsis sp. MPI-PUGE-AT-0042]
MRSLPVEVFEIIFSYLKQPHHDIVAEASGARSRLKWPRYQALDTAPAILSQVCRQWHAAALAIPKIWSPVRIDNVDEGIQGSSTDPRNKTVSIIPLLFRLNILHHHPWALEINMAKIPATAGSGPGDGRITTWLQNDSSNPHLTCALQATFKHPAVFSLVKLALGAEGDDVTLFNQSFPAVQSIVLRWEGSNYSPQEGMSRVTPSLPSMPRLSKAAFSSLPNGFFNLPCAQLTHLFIGGVGMSILRWLAVMDACRALQRASFCIQLRDSLNRTVQTAGFPTVDDPVELREHIDLFHRDLWDLTLLITDPFDPNARFHWPELKRFKFISNALGQDQWAPAFLDSRTGLLESLKSLTHLSLVSSESTQSWPSYAQLLETSTALEELVLHIKANIHSSTAPGGPDYLMEPLQYLTWETSGRHLPRLQKLRLDFGWPPFLGTSKDEFHSAYSDRFLTALGGLVASRSACLPLPTVKPRENLTDLILRFSAFPRPRFAKTLKDSLDRFVGDGQGLRVAIIVSDTITGELPEPNFRTYWTHWDDGFLDFADNYTSRWICPEEGICIRKFHSARDV